MILFLAAQDISRLEVGLLDSEGRLLSFQEFSASPEEYLAAVARFLSDHSVPLQTLERIVVVSGPGSFTSTRISVTIANGWSFALQIPVIGVSNSEGLSTKELLAKHAKNLINQLATGFVKPVYNRPAMITIK